MGTAEFPADTIFPTDVTRRADGAEGASVNGDHRTVTGVALPSLTAYRILFALCAGAAVLGASVARLVPRAAASPSPGTGTPGRSAECES
jgi:hypothetical protein